MTETDYERATKYCDRERRAAIVGALRTRIIATDKITATQFAIILTIESNVVTHFQMLEDSFDVSRAAHT